MCFTQNCFAVWCLARLIWSTQVWMKQPPWYQHIIITFPFNLDAVTPDHLCLQTENLWNSRGCFYTLPSCSGKQHLFSGLGTQHSAWCLAEDPFTSSWSPFAAFNLLDLWISHAKHQEGSFRWVTTVGEQTQPRAPHLSTPAEGLHCLALQEKEYSLHRLTSTGNFSIQPTSALTIPGISTLEGQAVPDLPCWREVGRCCDTAAQCPGVTHQEVTCQTATKTPHCQGTLKTTAERSWQWELPNESS